MPPQDLFAWDVYAQQLMFSGFGHPLWLPEPPEDTHREVLLGDVGFLSEGEFIPLFNSTKPAEDPLNARRGVPENFKMFAPKNLWKHHPIKKILQRVVFSQSITDKGFQGDIEGAISDQASVKFGWSFETNTNAGAIVVLEPPGVAEEIKSRQPIIAYMRENLKSWTGLANTSEIGWGLGLKEEEIVFVSGTLKTTQWALAAFKEDRFRGKEGHISAKIGSLASAGISCNISQSTLSAPFYRHGPQNTEKPPPSPDIIASSTGLDTTTAEAARQGPNQCLFIHYYKMKRRRFWRNRIVAHAGPHQLPPGNKDNHGNAQIGKWTISGDYEYQPYDPVSCLLDYILEHSNAKFAVASTQDLNNVFPPGTKIPDDIREAIALAAPQVTVDRDGVGTVVIRNYLEEQLFANIQNESTRASHASSEAELQRHNTITEGPQQNDMFHPAPIHPSIIYASQLFTQGYGYPIWEPEPDPASREVTIGDVGWLVDGSFFQLFNARIEKAWDQLRHDTPKKFVPFNPPNLIVRGPHSSTAKSPICPDTMQISNTDPTSFSFTCHRNAGAFLMFSPTAIETEIQSRRHIIDYMKQNFGSWMDYANDKYGLGLRERDLIFVCGTTKTSRWAVAALQGGYRNQSGTITADLSPKTGPPRLEVSISGREIPQTHQKAGPSRDLGSPEGDKGQGPSDAPKEERNDQCVFMHYYQMKKKLWILNPIKAAAGPNELPPSGPEESDTAVTVGDGLAGDESVKTTSTWNPVNDLLDYILSNSNAYMAIASDLDVYALFKEQEIPSDIPAALEEVRPLIDVDGNGVGTVVVDSQFVEDKPGQSAESTPYNTEELSHHERDEKSAVHDGAITALAYSPNGKYAASGSEDTTAIIWDVHSEYMVHRLPPHHETISALAFSHDNDVLASSNDLGIILWDVAGGTETRRLDTHAAVHSLAFSPDGSQLVAGTCDGSIFVWDTTTYADPVKLGKHMAVVAFAVFSADGKYMATGGTERECYVWDMGTLQPQSVLRGHRGMVCAAAFAPNGDRIVTASDDGTSRLWETETGEPRAILEGHSGAVWTVAFSPDGHRVATGSSDSTVKVWDAANCEQQQTLVGHSSMVNVVAFSPDGKYLASAAADHTVRLWKAEDGFAVATYSDHGDNVTAVAFSPDGTTIASGGHDGSVHIRPLGMPTTT